MMVGKGGKFIVFMW